ncbi:EF-hand calcium-binding domain [Carpediemonas membranifera]|uniref:EF-hand calcium-binding domain n=1 Tax=Carpediemonas membranifera TaxID=201153 RepID=A0A8J6E2R3_9EUKA|nr:EF-hand calcium-binding domain [Carpediemonas membranifera]|eukprot:KAG9394646.1 EF-hand calcium-binding domain [Carpediemonas membranifera]
MMARYANSIFESSRSAIENVLYLRAIEEGIDDDVKKENFVKGGLDELRIDNIEEIFSYRKRFSFAVLLDVLSGKIEREEPVSSKRESPDKKPLTMLMSRVAFPEDSRFTDNTSAWKRRLDSIGFVTYTKAGQFDETRSNADVYRDMWAAVDDINMAERSSTSLSSFRDAVCRGIFQIARYHMIYKVDYSHELPDGKTRRLRGEDGLYEWAIDRVQFYPSSHKETTTEDLPAVRVYSLQQLNGHLLGCIIHSYDHFNFPLDTLDRLSTSHERTLVACQFAHDAYAIPDLISNKNEASLLYTHKWFVTLMLGHMHAFFSNCCPISLRTLTVFSRTKRFIEVRRSQDAYTTQSAAIRATLVDLADGMAAPDESCYEAYVEYLQSAPELARAWVETTEQFVRYHLSHSTLRYQPPLFSIDLQQLIKMWDATIDRAHALERTYLVTTGRDEGTGAVRDTVLGLAREFAKDLDDVAEEEADQLRFRMTKGVIETSGEFPAVPLSGALWDDIRIHILVMNESFKRQRLCALMLETLTDATEADGEALASLADGATIAQLSTFNERAKAAVALVDSRWTSLETAIAQAIQVNDLLAEYRITGAQVELLMRCILPLVADSEFKRFTPELKKLVLSALTRLSTGQVQPTMNRLGEIGRDVLGLTGADLGEVLAVAGQGQVDQALKEDVQDFRKDLARRDTGFSVNRMHQYTITELQTQFMENARYLADTIDSWIATLLSLTADDLIDPNNLEESEFAAVVGNWDVQSVELKTSLGSLEEIEEYLLGRGAVLKVSVRQISSRYATLQSIAEKKGDELMSRSVALETRRDRASAIVSEYQRVAAALEEAKTHCDTAVEAVTTIPVEAAELEELMAAVAELDIEPLFQTMKLSTEQMDQPCGVPLDAGDDGRADPQGFAEVLYGRTDALISGVIATMVDAAYADGVGRALAMVGTNVKATCTELDRVTGAWGKRVEQLDVDSPGADSLLSGLGGYLDFSKLLFRAVESVARQCQATPLAQDATPALVVPSVLYEPYETLVDNARQIRELYEAKTVDLGKTLVAKQDANGTTLQLGGVGAVLASMRAYLAEYRRLLATPPHAFIADVQFEGGAAAMSMETPLVEFFGEEAVDYLTSRGILPHGLFLAGLVFDDVDSAVTRLENLMGDVQRALLSPHDDREELYTADVEKELSALKVRATSRRRALEDAVADYRNYCRIRDSVLGRCDGLLEQLTGLLLTKEFDALSPQALRDLQAQYTAISGETDVLRAQYPMVAAPAVDVKVLACQQRLRTVQRLTGTAESWAGRLEQASECVAVLRARDQVVSLVASLSEFYHGLVAQPLTDPVAMFSIRQALQTTAAADRAILARLSPHTEEIDALFDRIDGLRVEYETAVDTAQVRMRCETVLAVAEAHIRAVHTDIVANPAMQLDAVGKVGIEGLSPRSFAVASGIISAVEAAQREQMAISREIIAGIDVTLAEHNISTGERLGQRLEDVMAMRDNTDRELTNRRQALIRLVGTTRAAIAARTCFDAIAEPLLPLLQEIHAMVHTPHDVVTEGDVDRLQDEVSRWRGRVLAVDWEQLTNAAAGFSEADGTTVGPVPMAVLEALRDSILATCRSIDFAANNAHAFFRYRVSQATVIEAWLVEIEKHVSSVRTERVDIRKALTGSSPPAAVRVQLERIIALKETHAERGYDLVKCANVLESVIRQLPLLHQAVVLDEGMEQRGALSIIGPLQMRGEIFSDVVSKLTESIAAFDEATTSLGELYVFGIDAVSGSGMVDEAVVSLTRDAGVLRSLLGIENSTAPNQGIVSDVARSTYAAEVAQRIQSNLSVADPKLRGFLEETLDRLNSLRVDDTAPGEDAELRFLTELRDAVVRFNGHVRDAASVRRAMFIRLMAVIQDTFQGQTGTSLDALKDALDYHDEEWSTLGRHMAGVVGAGHELADELRDSDGCLPAMLDFWMQLLSSIGIAGTVQRLADQVRDRQHALVESLDVLSTHCDAVTAAMIDNRPDTSAGDGLESVWVLSRGLADATGPLSAVASIESTLFVTSGRVPGMTADLCSRLASFCAAHTAHHTNTFAAVKRTMEASVANAVQGTARGAWTSVVSALDATMKRWDLATAAGCLHCAAEHEAVLAEARYAKTRCAKDVWLSSVYQSAAALEISAADLAHRLTTTLDNWRAKGDLYRTVGDRLIDLAQAEMGQLVTVDVTSTDVTQFERLRADMDTALNRYGREAKSRTALQKDAQEVMDAHTALLGEDVAQTTPTATIIGNLIHIGNQRQAACTFLRDFAMAAVEGSHQLATALVAAEGKVAPAEEAISSVMRDNGRIGEPTSTIPLLTDALIAASEVLARSGEPHGPSFLDGRDSLEQRLRTCMYQAALATDMCVKANRADTRSTFNTAFTRFFVKVAEQSRDRIAAATARVEKELAALTATELDPTAFSELHQVHGDVFAIERVEAPVLEDAATRLTLYDGRLPPHRVALDDVPAPEPGTTGALTSRGVSDTLARLTRASGTLTAQMDDLRLDMAMPGIAANETERIRCLLALIDVWATNSSLVIDLPHDDLVASAELAALYQMSSPLDSAKYQLVTARDYVTAIVQNAGLDPTNVKFSHMTPSGARESTCAELLRDISNRIRKIDMELHAMPPLPNPDDARQYVGKQSEVLQRAATVLIQFLPMRVESPESYEAGKAVFDDGAHAIATIDAALTALAESPPASTVGIPPATLQKLALLLEEAQADYGEHLRHYESRAASLSDAAQQYEEMVRLQSAALDGAEQNLHDFANQALEALGRRRELNIDTGNSVAEEKLTEIREIANNSRLPPQMMPVSLNDTRQELQEEEELDALNTEIARIHDSVTMKSEELMDSKDDFVDMFNYCIESEISTRADEQALRDMYDRWCSTVNRLALLASTLGHAIQLTHLPELFTPYASQVQALHLFLDDAETFVIDFAEKHNGLLSEPDGDSFAELAEAFNPCNTPTMFNSIFDLLQVIPNVILHEQTFTSYAATVLELEAMIQAADTPIDEDNVHLAQLMDPHRLQPVLADAAEVIDRWTAFAEHQHRLVPSGEALRGRMHALLSATRAHTEAVALLELSAAVPADSFAMDVPEPDTTLPDEANEAGPFRDFDTIAADIDKKFSDAKLGRNPAFRVEAEEILLKKIEAAVLEDETVQGAHNIETAKRVLIGREVKAELRMSLGYFPKSIEIHSTDLKELSKGSTQERLHLIESTACPVQFVTKLWSAVRRVISEYASASGVTAKALIQHLGSSTGAVRDPDDPNGEPLLPDVVALLAESEELLSSNEGHTKEVAAAIDSASKAARSALSSLNTVKQRGMECYRRLAVATQYALCIDSTKATEEEATVAAEILKRVVRPLIADPVRPSVAQLSTMVSMVIEKLPPAEQRRLGILGEGFLHGPDENGVGRDYQRLLSFTDDILTEDATNRLRSIEANKRAFDMTDGFTIETLIMLFNYFDADGNRTLDQNEIQTMLRTLEISLTPSDERSLKRALDSNAAATGDRGLDLEHFFMFAKDVSALKITRGQGSLSMAFSDITRWWEDQFQNNARNYQMRVRNKVFERVFGIVLSKEDIKLLNSIVDESANDGGRRSRSRNRDDKLAVLKSIPDLQLPTDTRNVRVELSTM